MINHKCDSTIRSVDYACIHANWQLATFRHAHICAKYAHDARTDDIVNFDDDEVGSIRVNTDGGGGVNTDRWLTILFI